MAGDYPECIIESMLNRAHVIRDLQRSLTLFADGVNDAGETVLCYAGALPVLLAEARSNHDLDVFELSLAVSNLTTSFDALFNIAELLDWLTSEALDGRNNLRYASPVVASYFQGLLRAYDQLANLVFVTYAGDISEMVRPEILPNAGYINSLVANPQSYQALRAWTVAHEGSFREVIGNLLYTLISEDDSHAHVTEINRYFGLGATVSAELLHSDLAVSFLLTAGSSMSFWFADDTIDLPDSMRIPSRPHVRFAPYAGAVLSRLLAAADTVATLAASKFDIPIVSYGYSGPGYQNTKHWMERAVFLYAT